MAVSVAVVTSDGGRTSSKASALRSRAQLAQRPRQRGARPALHREHRPGDLHGPLVVEDAERGAGLPVRHPLVLGVASAGEPDGAVTTGLSSSPAPSGASAVRQVGDAQQQLAQLRARLVGLAAPAPARGRRAPGSRPAAPRRLVRVAGAAQRADLLGQLVDLAPRASSRSAADPRAARRASSLVDLVEQRRVVRGGRGRRCTASGSVRSRRTSIMRSDGTVRPSPLPASGSAHVDGRRAPGIASPVRRSVLAVTAVEVERLTVRYGDSSPSTASPSRPSAGEVTAVLGPNGAGKTRRSRPRGLPPADRRARCGCSGSTPSATSAGSSRRIGVMLQDGGVYPGIRPLEVPPPVRAFYADRGRRPTSCSSGRPRPTGAARTWRQLSGGEQQRLSLALALVGRPAGGVPRRADGRRRRRRPPADPRASSASCADGGCACLLTTHELDEAERVADRVVIIDRGRVVAAGTPAELHATGQATRSASARRRGLDLVAARRAALAAPSIEVGAGRVRRGDDPRRRRTSPRLTGWLAEHDLPLADLRGRAPAPGGRVPAPHRTTGDPPARDADDGRRR